MNFSWFQLLIPARWCPSLWAKLVELSRLTIELMVDISSIINGFISQLVTGDLLYLFVDLHRKFLWLALVHFRTISTCFDTSCILPFNYFCHLLCSFSGNGMSRLPISHIVPKGLLVASFISQMCVFVCVHIYLNILIHTIIPLHYTIIYTTIYYITLYPINYPLVI